MTKEFYTSVSVYGDNILYRGYRGGHSYKIKVPYKPKFYIESKTGKQDFKTLYGKEVSALEFEGIRDAKNFMKEYKDIDVDIYGMPNYVCQFLQEAYPYEAQADFDVVRICSIDIETTAYDGFPNTTTTEDAITAIGLHMSNTKVMHVWTTAVYDVSKYKYTEHKLDYRFFSNEKDMLRDYINWWKDPINTPDVMTGWNIRGFDIPYIVNRLYRVLGGSDEYITNKLSPWNKSVQETTFTVKGRKNDTYTIPGIEVIDYMDLFMKFGVLTYGPQESYSLDNIAKVVLGTTKEKYSGTSNVSELLYTTKNIHIPNETDLETCDDLQKSVYMRDKIQKEILRRAS